MSNADAGGISHSALMLWKLGKKMLITLPKWSGFGMESLRLAKRQIISPADGQKI
jgi:hypothetical protein